MDFRKQFELTMRSMSMAYHADLKLHVVGSSDISYYQKVAEELGVMNNCIWYRAVSRIL